MQQWWWWWRQCYVPLPKVKEHKVSKQNFLQKLNVVQDIKAPSSSINKNIDEGEGKKGWHGRKKKVKNSLCPPPTLVIFSGDSDSGGGGKNLNFE